MKYEVIEKPRRLVRLWHLLRDGFPVFGRYRRYVATLVPAIGAVWLLTALYLALTPPSYTSTMTLILPGTGVGGSINLESIGQASTTTASAFSGSTLSPTENYKRLLAADVTLRRAAASIGEDGDRFPMPTIKLTDQTNLIEVRVTGPTAAQAQRRGAALRAAFLAGLDGLRNDEAVKRESADRARIADLQRKARDAQRRVLQFQGATGLVSLDQFNSRVAALDTLREREREARTTYRQQAVATARLAGGLRSSTGQARAAMLLKADPIFQGLLLRYAASGTDIADKGALLGPHHADMEELIARNGGVRQALVARGAVLTGLPANAVLSFADLSVSDGRAQLFQAMTTGESQAAGTGAGIAEIRAQIAQMSGDKGKLVGDAATLSDLVRDQRVAEAVFSAALARLDTNKADPFASYPLVQTLEAPSLPRKASSPSKTLALAGAAGASLLLLLGFLLLWLRQPIIAKMLPTKAPPPAFAPKTSPSVSSPAPFNPPGRSGWSADSISPDPRLDGHWRSFRLVPFT